MSDSFENKELEQAPSLDEAQISEIEIDEDESTVFSAPAEHKNKKVLSGGKRRLLSIIAAVLAVSVLVGGTLTIIKLIPEMKKEEVPLSDFIDNISVVTDFATENSTSAAPSKIIVTNTHGDFTFLLKQGEAGGSSSEYYWTLDGIDHAKLSPTKLNEIAADSGTVSAIRTIEKSVDECGFSNPKIKFKVEKSDDTSYTVIVGNKSIDGLGYYMTVENSGKVYIVRESMFENFEFSLLDLTDQTDIPKTIFNSDTSGNVVADGTYAYFDSLTLSGKLYPETITIVNNKDENKTAEIVPYKISTPMERYANAEALAPLVNIFSKSTSVIGNCALEVNDETLKLFGLDDPDAIVAMTINGETKTFKFSIVEDEDEKYCAIVYDGAIMIRKGNISDFAFLSTSPDSYYYKSLFMYSINDLATLNVKTKEDNLNFIIDNHGGNATTNRPYTVTINGIDVSEGFQGYYNDFTCIQCNSFDVSEITASPDATITFSFLEDGETVVSLYRANDNEYQYSINGITMGKIPSSEYNKMINNFKAIAAGQIVKP